MPMRNDANDDFDDVPSLRMRADIPDDDDFLPNRQPHVQARPAPVAAAKVKGPSTGPLWALVGALLCAFGFLAWWSFQQISLMEQQLVATQESFARISEDAAGRLQEFSGKVVAGQSNVMSDSEALKLQIKQLESKLQDQGKQFDNKLLEQYKQQQATFGPSADLDKELAQLIAQATEQQNTNTQLQASNKELQAQVKTLVAEVTALKKPRRGWRSGCSAQEHRCRHHRPEKSHFQLGYRSPGAGCDRAQEPAGQGRQYRRVRRLPRPGHP
nr:hypothetical protein GCM10020185_13860 [Pseudomonas brassicacearum subsp. brassicacearum]